MQEHEYHQQKAAEKEKLQPFNQSAPGPILAKDHVAFKDEPTVTMMFPKPVMITHHQHGLLRFEAGTQEVPESLADDWYLKANKVERYEPKKEVPVKKEFKDVEPQEQTSMADPAPNLEAMTKAELVEYASSTFQLDLPNSYTKADMITAIQGERDKAA